MHSSLTGPFTAALSCSPASASPGPGSQPSQGGACPPLCLVLLNELLAVCAVTSGTCSSGLRCVLTSTEQRRPLLASGYFTSTHAAEAAAVWTSAFPALSVRGQPLFGHGETHVLGRNAFIRVLVGFDVARLGPWWFPPVKANVDLRSEVRVRYLQFWDMSCCGPSHCSYAEENRPQTTWKGSEFLICQISALKPNGQAPRTFWHLTGGCWLRGEWAQRTFSVGFVVWGLHSQYTSFTPLPLAFFSIPFS